MAICYQNVIRTLPWWQVALFAVKGTLLTDKSFFSFSKIVHSVRRSMCSSSSGCLSTTVLIAGNRAEATSIISYVEFHLVLMFKAGSRGFSCDCRMNLPYQRMTSLCLHFGAWLLLPLHFLLISGCPSPPVPPDSLYAPDIGSSSSPCWTPNEPIYSPRFPSSW